MALRVEMAPGVAGLPPEECVLCGADTPAGQRAQLRRADGTLAYVVGANCGSEACKRELLRQVRTTDLR